jgi:hypothetical protein
VLEIKSLNFTEVVLEKFFSSNDVQQNEAGEAIVTTQETDLIIYSYYMY